ncbi:hypothetical protein LINPERPRIM_LOCUS31291, partial [Linum perenne]
KISKPEFLIFTAHPLCTRRPRRQSITCPSESKQHSAGRHPLISRRSFAERTKKVGIIGKYSTFLSATSDDLDSSCYSRDHACCWRFNCCYLRLVGGLIVVSLRQFFVVSFLHQYLQRRPRDIRFHKK